MLTGQISVIFSEIEHVTLSCLKMLLVFPAFVDVSVRISSIIHPGVNISRLLSSRWDTVPSVRSGLRLVLTCRRVGVAAAVSAALLCFVQEL